MPNRGEEDESDVHVRGVPLFSPDPCRAAGERSGGGDGEKAVGRPRGT